MGQDIKRHKVNGNATAAARIQILAIAKLMLDRGEGDCADRLLEVVNDTLVSSRAKKSVSQEVVDRAFRLQSEGMRWDDIADALGMHRSRMPNLFDGTYGLPSKIRIMLGGK